MEGKIARKNLVKIGLKSLLISVMITAVVMFLFVPVHLTGGEAGLNEIWLMPFDPQLLKPREPEATSPFLSPQGMAIVPDMVYHDLEKEMYVGEGITVFVVSFLVGVGVRVWRGKKRVHSASINMLG